MNGDCQRWAELADQDALGEPLPSDAQAFQRAHEASCADCAREARLWRALGVKEREAPVEQREVESILSLAAQDRARQQSFSQHWKGALVIVGGVTAAAAAALLWIGGTATPGQPSLGQQQALRSPTVATSASQLPTPALASAHPPMESDTAPTCSRVVPGATVCLGRGAVLGRRSISGPHREIEVTRGRAVVSLDPQPAGTSFSLTTAGAKVTAVGTIFSVDVSEDGAIVTRVVEGKVRVRVGDDDKGRALHAGQAFRVGEQEPTPLSNRERDLDLGLLSIVGENERGAGPSPSTGKPPARVDQVARPDRLEYARSLRAKGDFRQAADVYRKINADSPSSPSGRAALVSLGDLLLTLHDPQGALNAFESYLVGGGDLAQEALFGCVRALRALNRPGDEQRAIQRFLSAYPDAPQSRILRARLAAMGQ